MVKIVVRDLTTIFNAQREEKEQITIAGSRIFSGFLTGFFFIFLTTNDHLRFDHE
ncbi:MAG: hypothetical protein LIP11_02545 [Clostridiales bacterium]|nr:hypothetical protein [Clostridiales bacterium]